MELMDSGDLDMLLKAIDKGDHAKLSFDEQTTICHKIARGLMFLHERGMVHRDIKPANILLNRKGEVKLSTHDRIPCGCF